MSDDAKCDCGHEANSHEAEGSGLGYEGQQCSADCFECECKKSRDDVYRAALASRDAQLARLCSGVVCTKCAWVGHGVEAVSAFRGSVGWECPRCHYACSPPISELERQLAEARAEVERASAENERLVADYEAVHKQLAEAQRERDEARRERDANVKVLRGGDHV